MNNNNGFNAIYGTSGKMASEEPQQEFADLINQWTDAVIVVLNKHGEPAAMAVATELGLLGQQLLYKAHALGMDRTVAILKEQRNAAGV